MINFLTGNIGSANKIALKVFKKLPADVYEKSKGYYFRFRKYSRITIENVLGKKKYLLKITFFKKKRNRYAGGKKEFLKKLIKKFKLFCNLIFKPILPFVFSKKKSRSWFSSIKNKMFE